MKSVSLSLMILLPLATALGADRGDVLAEIQSFNFAFSAAVKSMNNTAVMALWADNGVALLPNSAATIGKSAIAEYMDRVTASLAGAHMEQFELTCQGIVVSGDWASEWCREHQVVELSRDKPKFEGWGNLLFVLHRGAHAKWLLEREMWIQALPPS